MDAKWKALESPCNGTQQLHIEQSNETLYVCLFGASFDVVAAFKTIGVEGQDVAVQGVDDDVGEERPAFDPSGPHKFVTLATIGLRDGDKDESFDKLRMDVSEPVGDAAGADRDGSAGGGSLLERMSDTLSPVKGGLSRMMDGYNSVKEGSLHGKSWRICLPRC